MADLNGALEGPAPALWERVRGLTEDVHGLRSELRELQRAISSQFKVLGDQLTEKSKPQWTALGVALTAVLAIAGLAYLPIRSGLDDLKSSQALLLERAIYQREYLADQTRINNTFTRMESVLVSRAEHEARDRERLEQLKSITARIDEAKTRIMEDEKTFLPRSHFDDQHKDLQKFVTSQNEALQRQITQNTERLNQVWNARDALLDMRARLDRLEEQRR